MSTAAAGGRRSNAPSSSTDAESAQWKSSSTSTSGFVAASCSSSACTARWLRYRSCCSAASRPLARVDSEGKTCASSGSDVVVQGGESRWLETLDVLVQSIHVDRERQVSLELRRRAREDEVPARLREPGELAEQPRLADPRLSDQLDRAAREASIELVEDVIERTELVGTPDEVRGRRGHGPPARINQGRLIEKSGCEIRVPP